MFDMEKIGKRISDLRKERGLTQMALADRLGISYQAVSHWEHGSTMPDIAKLPELADILGISIEELLGDGHKAQIAEQIVKDEPPEGIDAEDLKDFAPILRSEQFRKAYEQAEREGVKLDLSEIVTLAPFLDEQTLASLAERAVGDEKADLSALVPLAPFLDEHTLASLAERAVGNGKADLSALVPLAPFLDEHTLASLAERAVGDEKADLSALVPLAPFLDGHTLAQIARALLARGVSGTELLPLFPFLPQSFWQSLL